MTVKAGGTPIPDASLTLTGPNGFSATGTTDGSGSFTFTNVGAGSGYSLDGLEGRRDRVPGQHPVTSGSATNVNLTLPVGSVKVTVTDGSGPLSGVAVTLTGPELARP